MSLMQKILVSGVQPTGRPHIGNYFGAMKQFVDLQDKYESRIFVANMHALTTIQNKKELEENSFDVILDFLAVGIDPNKVTMYLQTDVPHVAELAWIFNCITTVPYLERAHAYKDSVANGKEASVGLFDYPMLMAADILAPDADVVPVGKDQKQHVEITRDTAEKFNRIFGETFKLPESLILDQVATVPGIDGRKMSKSYGNTIPLFASDKEIEEAVMSIVTDSSGEYPENVFKIHQLVRPNDYIDKLYTEKKGRYKDLKEELIKDLKNFIAPLRERRAEWASKPDEVEKIITEGGMKMRKVVHQKMQEVREKVGLIHHD